MAVTIPIVPDAPHFGFSVELTGVSFGFELRWNTRDEAWYLSVRTAEDEPILTSIKVVIDMPLLVRSADPRLPAGQLIAVDTSGDRRDPAMKDLGNRVQLLYFEPGESV